MLHKASTPAPVGVTYNCRTCKWRASIEIDGNHIFIGDFKSSKQAQLAYDMEVIRRLGEKASGKLNRSYEINRLDGTSKFQVKACDCPNLSFIAQIGENESESSPQCSSDKVANSNDSPVSVNSLLPLLSGTTALPRADYSRRWNDRIITSHAISAIFSYEVQIPVLSSQLASLQPSLPPCSSPQAACLFDVYQRLGLHINLQEINYPMQAGGKRKLTCGLVLDAPLFGFAVQPGDLLISINGQSLVFGLGQEFDPKCDDAVPSEATLLEKLCRGIINGIGVAPLGAAKSAAGQAPAGGLQTLRFIRRPGLSPNFTTSVVEISMLMKEVTPSARFSTQAAPGTAEIPGPLKLHLVFTDSQAPPIIKRMLTGHHIPWDGNAGQSNAAFALTPTGAILPANGIALAQGPVVAAAAISSIPVDPISNSMLITKLCDPDDAPSRKVKPGPSPGTIVTNMLPYASAVGSSATLGSSPSLAMHSQIEQSCELTGVVYRDKNKWIAAINIPVQDQRKATPEGTECQQLEPKRKRLIWESLVSVATGATTTTPTTVTVPHAASLLVGNYYYIGKYDMEDDAIAAFKRVKRELESTGTTSFKRPSPGASNPAPSQLAPWNTAASSAATYSGVTQPHTTQNWGTNYPGPTPNGVPHTAQTGGVSGGASMQAVSATTAPKTNIAPHALHTPHTPQQLALHQQQQQLKLQQQQQQQFYLQQQQQRR